VKKCSAQDLTKQKCHTPIIFTIIQMAASYLFKTIKSEESGRELTQL